MDKNIIDAVETLLPTAISTSPMPLYQIKINGVPAIYSGVRVYKFYKVALNKVTKMIERLLMYNATININKYTPEENIKAIQILENAGFQTGYSAGKTQKEQAKMICAELIKNGTITITEI